MLDGSCAMPHALWLMPHARWSMPMPSTLGHATTTVRESLRDKSDKREEVS